MTETDRGNETPDSTRQEPDICVVDRRRRTVAAGGLLGLALVVLVVTATTSGFGPYEDAVRAARPPTLWDWLQLLIVPAVLALGALWFNKTQKDTELRIADKARAADRDIAEQARTADREIAEARQRQATLEAYYDRMTELLLDHGLRESDKDSEVRSIARARTVAVIRSLDADRNQQLLTFLRTSELIRREQPIIDLAGTDLSGADLSGTDLRETDLSGVNLREAYLREANLFSTDLSEADLRGADLSETDLSEAILYGVSLIDADLSAADLSEADLSAADLSRVDLSGADLSGANLSGTDLGDTNLSWANLSRANLDGANLGGADLTMANLSEVDLSKTNLRWANLCAVRGWTIEQLEQAKVMAGAIMPDEIQLGVEETIYSRRIEGPTFAEWKTQYLARQSAENRPPSP